MAAHRVCAWWACDLLLFDCQTCHLVMTRLPSGLRGFTSFCTDSPFQRSVTRLALVPFNLLLSTALVTKCIEVILPFLVFCCFCLFQIIFSMSKCDRTRMMFKLSLKIKYSYFTRACGPLVEDLSSPFIIFPSRKFWYFKRVLAVMLSW